MEIKTTFIDGLLLIRPAVFEDNRGCFFESWNAHKFNAAVGMEITFVQDNVSISKADVIRGLHYQIPPSAQSKLIRVVSGSILDIAVDIRPDSKTYGQHFSVKLDTESRWQLWIPEGFAHGFRAIEVDTVVMYKCTDFFNPACERSLKWDDTDLGIDWGVSPQDTIMSDKDSAAVSFKDLEL
ncbi:MAG: dTDP-4-dehydrorhamnose 3,5-epimerase [Bacteroidetes bacterium]|jgi:dTDP-4-dehydrorhamnose 3,5-epimerase|nr:dTDP-4-dehydrorhamnose 3,5-epimerase [Bacteroidota bacterium]MDA0980640.1 dTDP-4-dehydrorhamnose 3,5-epimerase [Bacteroidota bacterium]